MDGLIYTAMVMILKFEGFKDVSFKDKIRWIAIYPIILIVFIGLTTPALWWIVSNKLKKWFKK